MINEFSVSGTTYAPEGTVFDNNGQQVTITSPLDYVTGQLFYMIFVRMTDSCLSYMLTN